MEKGILCYRNMQAMTTTHNVIINEYQWAYSTTSYRQKKKVIIILREIRPLIT